MNEIKLKPCPFCGSEAEIKKHDDLTFRTLVYIRCKECFAQTHIFDESSEWYFEKYMIECWNRRVNDE